MNPALRLFLSLQFKGLLRSLLRQIRRPSGAILAGVVVVFAIFGLFVFFTEDIPVSAELAAILVPGIALLLSIGSSHSFGSPVGTAFTGAEINILFSGPVTRRELLFYRLVFDLCGILLIAGFISVFLRTGFGGFGWALLFSALAFGIAHAIGFVVSELIHASARISPRLPNILWWFVAGAGFVWTVEVVAVLAGLGRSIWDNPEAALVVESLRTTSFVTVALFPFEPLRLMAEADSHSAMLIAIALGFLVYAAILGAGLAIDADFRLTGVIKGERVERTREAMRAGEVHPWMEMSKPRKSRLPMFPYWRGFGPVAWSSAVHAFRGTGRWFLRLAAILSILIVLVHWFAPDFIALVRNELSEVVSVPLIAVAGIYFLIGAACVSGFGGVSMDMIKSLPVKPVALASGVILPSALATWGMVTVLAVTLGIWLNQPFPALWLSAFFFPALILSKAVNASFRSTFSEEADPNSLAVTTRELIVSMISLIALLCAAVTAAALALAASLLWDPPLWVPLTLAWITFTAIAASFLPVAAQSLRTG